MPAGVAQKSVYLRGIPLQLVRDAKAIAARRGITLAAFVSDALARAMRDEALEPKTSDAKPALLKPALLKPVTQQTHTKSRERSTPELVSKPEASNADDFSDEIAWFERNRARLLREYAGQYVAVIGETVVDHDADFEALAQRVFTQRGAHNVFMPFVAVTAKPLRVRSPLSKRAH